MDEMQSREFHWYRLGSLNVGHEPTLDHSQFVTHYERYKRCTRTIQRYEERRRRRIARRRGSVYQDDVYLERLMRSIRQEQEELEPLAAAVSRGRSLENGDRGMGGAGVPAYRLPDLPVLVGAGAKMLPHLDTEPWMRDP